MFFFSSFEDCEHAFDRGGEKASLTTSIYTIFIIKIYKISNQTINDEFNKEEQKIAK